MGWETWYRPYVSDWIADAVGISSFVRRLRPQFVCGQEVFAYGLATALCRGIPRLLMPWGGDIHMYSETSALAFRVVQYSLRHVDLVVAGSPLTEQFLRARFGVEASRMHLGGLWALDRQCFQRASADQRVAVCKSLGIDPSATVVMNIRRFFPAWGSDVALKALIEVARHNSRIHCLLLGGSGTEPFVAEARRIVSAAGLSRQFTLFDGHLPLTRYAELISVTDVGVSLMREKDLRPLASILEAAASQAALVLSDQPEYRLMESLGLQAKFCNADDPEAAASAITEYIGDHQARMAAALSNLRYVGVHEDGLTQARNLLERMRSICDGDQ